MTSLLHHDAPITDEEATSYVHGTGPWSRFLLTPWPVQSLVEGAVVLGVGLWACVALGLSNPWAGLGVAVLAILVSLLVAAPGAYTETHRDFAARYFAARRVHSDHDMRSHPYLILALYPVLGALVGAFGGHHSLHESATVRLVGAAVGAVFGLVYALVRIRQARRTPLA